MKYDAETVTALIRRRIESRYQRIRFVYGELAKVDAKIRAEGRSGQGALPPGPDPAVSGVPGPDAAYSFEDIVFSTIDFSVYRKIDEKTFSLLFDEGLEDFDETFYQKVFKTNRENIKKTIFRFFLKAGPFYVCRKTNPLILSIMRNLHTSLEFAPLLAPNDLAGNSGQYRSIIAALDGVVIRHDDGMETRLFTRNPETEEKAVLWGTFHPLGKAHTIPLL